MTRDINVWAGTSFRHVSTLKVDRDKNGSVSEFLPQDRYAKKDQTKLHRYGDGPFCRIRIAQDVRAPGVYMLTSEGEPRYVGRCRNSLRERWGPRGYGAIHPRNCYVGGQQTNCRINNLVLQEAKAGRKLELWFSETSEPGPLEARLITKLSPPWNLA